jgi:predicted phosphohydrolase
MKIRVYSDIHQDHYIDGFHQTQLASDIARPKVWYPPELPDDKDTILLLVGDLWIGTRFIEWAGYSWIGDIATRFKQVLIVLGNHDYWPQGDLSITNGGDKCNAMLQDAGILNVQVLDCDTFTVDDFMFVGATLWTDMLKRDPLTMHNMNNFMRYDGKIAYATGSNGGWARFTSEKWVKTHYNHKRYIESIAQQNRDKNIVVLTHHLPLSTLVDPKYIGASENNYYCSDLSDLILDNVNIKYWFYGHTHWQHDTYMVHCRLINNAVGYLTEENEGWGRVKHGVIEL